MHSFSLDNSVEFSQEIRQWFVLRDLKRANAKLPAYLLLQSEGVSQFTPMQERLTTRFGKQKCEVVPVIHDLLFANATRDELDPIIERTPTLQYRYVKGAGYKVPMTVSDKEMNEFIHAVECSDTQKYYLPGEITPAMYGREVRIIGGPLTNYTGRLLSMRGSKTKRLLVELKDFIIAAVEVNPDYIQFV